jgi:hypothetical protein
MKLSKLLQIFFLALLILGMINCRKDRSCTCVYTPTYESSSGQVYVLNGVRTTTSITVYKKASKADMKTFCGNSSYVSQQLMTDVNGTTFTVTSINDTKCSISN